jgi:hypothetical protein
MKPMAIPKTPTMYESVVCLLGNAHFAHWDRVGN